MPNHLTLTQESLSESSKNVCVWWSSVIQQKWVCSSLLGSNFFTRSLTRNMLLILLYVVTFWLVHLPDVSAAFSAGTLLWWQVVWLEASGLHMAGSYPASRDPSKFSWILSCQSRTRTCPSGWQSRLHALLSSSVVGMALARISRSSMLCRTALAFTGTLDSLNDGQRFLCFFSSGLSSSFFSALSRRQSLQSATSRSPSFLRSATDFSCSSASPAMSSNRKTCQSQGDEFGGLCHIPSMAHIRWCLQRSGDRSTSWT